MIQIRNRHRILVPFCGVPIALIVATGIALSTLAPGKLRAESGSANTISVSGRGDISVAPNLVEIHAGVVSSALTAETALAENSKVMDRVLKGLSKLGLTPPDVETRAFSVSPVYERPRGGSGAVPSLAGFQVVNEILVRLRETARTGTILDALIGLGANRVNGITFRVDDASSFLDKARRAAVADARRKAEILATAAGVRVGRVLSIEEGRTESPQPLFQARAAFAEAVPIEPGEQAISTRVTVVFALE